MGEFTQQRMLIQSCLLEQEINLSADVCFTNEEQEFLEHQIIRLEGKTEKQKNPYKSKYLKRHVWVIARLGGWKDYESKRNRGITTLWTGLKYLKDALTGLEINRHAFTR
jgi:hypothetical protein